MKDFASLLSMSSSATSFVARTPNGHSRLPRGRAQMSLETEEGKAWHALGYNIGSQLGDLKPLLETPEEIEDLVSGVKAFLEGKEPAAPLQQYVPKANDFLQERAVKQAEKDAAAGKEVLEAAAKEEGAKKTESGLVVLIEREGDGASPSATDTVEVHYEGKLIDGKTFDSSYARGESISFPLNQVIKGWTEGLQMMKVGSKAKLTIPSDIAYGDRGSPPTIPGKATLIFTVELLAIK